MCSMDWQIRRLHRCYQAQLDDFGVSIQAADVLAGSCLCYHWLSSQSGGRDRSHLT